jgi:replicative DNA helicase
MQEIADVATEDVVLGSVIFYPKEYSRVAQYVPDRKVFTQIKSKSLWDKLTKMIKEGKNIDVPILCASLTNEDNLNGITTGYILDITGDVCGMGMMESYAQIIYEKYLLRKTIEATEDIKKDALHRGGDVYTLINEAHSLMGELIRVRPGEKFTIDKAMSDTLNTMQEGNKKMIKTGYKEIDSLAGGLTRGEITIVGGRPGHGKTTFLVNLLASLVKGGYKVAMFNRELPNSEVIKKLICIENPRLNYRDVRKGIVDKSNIGFIEELKKASKKIADIYGEDRFIMFDTIRDLPKTASEVKKFEPDVIIDDYIQLVSPSGRETERRLQLERICNEYKWLAKETKCAVILASQLNRSLESRSKEAKRPQLSDLAESGAIEQVAENVFFVYYSYKVDPSMHSKNEIRLIASKVRYGESSEITLNYNGDICTIYDNWTIPHAKELDVTKELPF